MITRFLKRPLHFFGTLGVLAMLVGGGILAFLIVLWFLGHGPIGNRPLLFFGILITIMGVQLFSLGILAELFVTFSKEHQLPVIVRDTGGDA